MKVQKKIKSLSIIGIAIIALILTSCSGSPESTKVIPNGTNIVGVFDIYSIITKGKLDELSDMKFFKSFIKDIRNENRDISKLVEEIVEDPSITGIDFQSDLFAFYIDEAKDERYVSFSIEISGADDFSEFIEKSTDKLKLKIDIYEEDNYSYTMLGREGILGWDDDITVLLIAQNYTSRENLDLELEALMELKSDDQIGSNESFNNFYDNKKDINVWVSTNLFENSREFTQMENDLDYDLTDSYISSYLNFEDGQISLKTSFNPNKKIQKMLDENAYLDQSFNTDLLEYFRKKNFFTSSLAINLMEYYNFLENTENFEELKKEVKDKLDINLKDLFETLNGSTLYSLSGFENMKYSYLGWGTGFNKDAAKPLDSLRSINDAGVINEKNRALLNQGKTIKTSKFYGKYCINIKNILDQGGNAESAIASNSKVNWFEGGWEYGRFDERTVEEFVPLMSLAFDINGSKNIKKLLAKVPEGEITQNGNYYEFKFNSRYPAYLAYNEEVFLVTNDKKCIESFKDGGLSDENLDDADISSNITDLNLYMFGNLNYDEYPKNIKKEIKLSQNDMEKKLFKIWNNFAKSFEIKLIDNTTIEMLFTNKNSDLNSLDLIISTLDNNIEDLMHL